MIRLAGVKAVRYTGTKAKKLWEVGGRNVPVLERGDIVLVGEAVAISLVRGGRRGMFELVEGEITIDVPALSEIVVDEEGEHQEGQNPPADAEAEAAETAQAEESQGEENPQGDESVTGDGETGATGEAGSEAKVSEPEEPAATAVKPTKRGK